MVGHTGDFDAARRAIETLDACIGRVVDVARSRGGEIVITADHGNAEQLHDDATGQSHTAHTLNRVPFVYVGRPATDEETAARCRMSHRRCADGPAETAGNDRAFARPVQGRPPALKHAAAVGNSRALWGPNGIRSSDVDGATGKMPDSPQTRPSADCPIANRHIVQSVVDSRVGRGAVP
jgi:hypothetical protein